MPLKESVANALSRMGFSVREDCSARPPGASWSLEVVSPPPFKVHLKVVGLEPHRVVVGMGIVLSPEHRKEVMRLDRGERVKLAAKILERVLSICPYCRVALQPTVEDFQVIVVESHILLRDEREVVERVVDDVHRLVNVFLAVNSVLWERFPLTGSRDQVLFM